MLSLTSWGPRSLPKMHCWERHIIGTSVYPVYVISSIRINLFDTLFIRWNIHSLYFSGMCMITNNRIPYHSDLNKCLFSYMNRRLKVVMPWMVKLLNDDFRILSCIYLYVLPCLTYKSLSLCLSLKDQKSHDMYKTIWHR